MNPSNSPIALLGIMTDKSNTEEIIQKIQTLIEDYHKDLQPRYVATANVDFLVQANSCLSSDALNQELMHILREAKIVTVDGMPLLWLSHLLGSPIKERVTGVDLVPKLASALSKKQQSLFLLGGNEKILKLCILYLQSLNPGIRITGALHPKIYTEGEIQESNDERDDLLAEQINRAAPDILFINLGNPKQEIWFERMKHKLHVPVSIGVGGTFDLLTGTIPRAPEWMQKYGLEWLFRLYQEPKRLFSRYLRDLIKFPILALPVVIYHNLNRLFCHFFCKENDQIHIRNNRLFISADQTVAAVPLPCRLNQLVAEELKKHLDDLFSQDAIILDFKEVRYIDLEGLALLLMMWRRARWEKKQLLALDMSPGIKLLLRLHRIWDYISPYVCNTPREVLLRISKSGNAPNFYDAIQQNHNKVVLSFFGRLDNQLDFDAYIKKIHHILFQKECILDMSYCTYIDNLGISFLLKLKKNKPKLFTDLSLYNIPPAIARQLRFAKVYDLFEILPDLNSVFE
jgi:N-acetylglucosaminyldiphosphoundecaprenol N-acetyl-beta-D-mannosaminyltransferase